MAFNPFSVFRKYSKVIFVVVTVICMFVFILSSGIGAGGDFFDQVARALGNKSAREGVGRLYDRPVSMREFMRVRSQRIVANRFMELAVAKSHEILLDEMRQDIERFDFETQKLLKTADEAMELLGKGEAAKAFNILIPSLQQLQQITRLKLTGEENRVQRDHLQRFFGIVEYRIKQLALRNVTKSNFHFGGSASVDDVFDFMIWQKQADDLNIQLTQADVFRLIRVDTLGGLERRRGAFLEVERQLSRDLAESFGVRDTSGDALLEALTAEFRVRIAQQVLLGVSGVQYTTQNLAMQSASLGVNLAESMLTTPVTLTSFDAYQYFRENRTEIDATVVKIPVDTYVGSVKDEPTEADLQKLYDEYKNTEPTPLSDKPGFRQPIKAKVQYVQTMIGEPRYRQLVPYVKAAYTFTNLGQALPLHPSLIDEELIGRRFAEYQQLKQPRSTFTTATVFRLHDSSLYSGQALASLLASLAAGPPASGFAWTVPMQYYFGAFANEYRNRAVLGAATLLAGSSSALQASAYALAFEPPGLSLQSMRPLLESELTTDLSQLLLQQDMEKLRKDILEMAKSKQRDKLDIPKYAEDYAKARGWVHGRSQELRDFYSLPSDPGLKQLVDSYQKIVNDPRLVLEARDPLNERVSVFFFKPTIAFSQSMSLFEPRYFPSGEPPWKRANLSEFPITLAWKFEQTDARTPPFEEAKPAVLAAWKFDKARVLAKESADKLASGLGALGGDVQKIRDIVSKLPTFEIKGAARLNPIRSSEFGLTKYYPYEPPIEHIRYPTKTFNSELFALQDKPLGSAVVIDDLPKANYYIAVSTRIGVPSEAEFTRVYTAYLQSPLLEGFFFSEMEKRKTDEFRAQAVQSLRDKAKLFIDREKLKDFDRGLRDVE
jgi:hypothetical protein